MALLACGIALAACSGGTEPTTEVSPGQATEALGKSTDVDFASCPKARERHELAEELLATSQQAVAEEKQVKAAEAKIQNAKKILQKSLATCGEEARSK